MNEENIMDMNFEDKIIETDTLDKLYQLFGDIEETVIQRTKDNFSYKKINDEINIFIMIDRETLQNLLKEYNKYLIEKNLKRRHYKKSYILLS